MMRTLQPSNMDTLSAIGTALRAVDIAMLTTLRENGQMVSRPLSTLQVTTDVGLIRFLVSLSSGKVSDIARYPRVNLAYASKDRNTYVSVSGEARINRDPSAKEGLWSDAMNAFFPGGKSDPDLVVMEVVTHSIDAWEGPDSWLEKAVSFLIARTTGDTSVLGRETHVDLRDPSAMPSVGGTVP